MRSIAAPRRARWLAVLLALLLGASALHGGRAADPLAYTVAIAPTGHGEIDAALHDAATLISLREHAAVGPFALLARARADVARFAIVLQSFGYDAASVAVTIAGHSLDAPDLVNVLDALPDGSTVPVAVAVTLGPLFHLGRIDLLGEVPAEAQAALQLHPGDPALAADVLAAGARVLLALRRSGHALAKVGEPVATLRMRTSTLDVSYQVEPGPRVDVGAISITGLERTNQDYVRRNLELHQGEQFDPDKIETARADLAANPAFASVRIDPAEALDASGQLPMDVNITERKLRGVNFSAGYSTDLGGNASVTWTHRNLFGNAEQLVLTAAATNLGGTASVQPGYTLSALLTLPNWQRTDQSLIFNASAIDQWLEAYTVRAIRAGATLERKLTQITPDLIASVGVEATQAHIVQEGASYDYVLLQTPLGLRFDSTHNLFDPTHGFRASLSLTPSQNLGSPGSTFVIAQASGSTYLDVGALLSGTQGRSVLAARVLVGGVEGATTFDIPPDQRLYAGGGGTVRGYRFQSIGPQFADSKPMGGTSIDVGSVELRQRFGETYGAAAFVDAGQVGTGGVPFEGQFRLGAGLGARYYTAFGPIRVDFAVPLTSHPGSDAFELYLGIGQAF